MARFLVVDDERGVRSFLVGCLETEGHEVEAAATAGEGLAVLAARAVDVLLSDLKLPDVDGLTLVERALALQPELQVIVITAHGNVESAVAAMKLGAFDYLQKPIASPGALRPAAVETAGFHTASPGSHGRTFQVQEHHAPQGPPRCGPIQAVLQTVARDHSGRQVGYA